MITSASEQPSKIGLLYIWPRSLLRVLGPYWSGTFRLLLGLFNIRSGASELELIEPSSPAHNNQLSHAFGALGLVLGGILIAAGLFTLWRNFNGKAL